MQHNMLAYIAEAKALLWPYLLIFIAEWPPDLNTRVLVGIMDDDMIAISSDIHCREEVRAVQQQSVGQACNCSRSHLEGGHCGPIIPSFQRYLWYQVTTPTLLSHSNGLSNCTT